jgi:hypothetical protein
VRALAHKVTAVVARKVHGFKSGGGIKAIEKSVVRCIC